MRWARSNSRMRLAAVVIIGTAVGGPLCAAQASAQNSARGGDDANAEYPVAHVRATSRRSEPAQASGSDDGRAVHVDGAKAADRFTAAPRGDGAQPDDAVGRVAPVHHVEPIRAARTSAPRSRLASAESRSSSQPQGGPPRRSGTARRPSQFEQALSRDAWSATPAAARRAHARQVRYEEPLPEPIPEPVIEEFSDEQEETFYDEGFEPLAHSPEGCSSCGGGCDDNGTCLDPFCGGMAYSAYPYRPPFICPWRWWENLSLFGSVQGFRGPVDQGRNGNFGFGYGLNWGGPLWNWANIGWQVGGRVVHSNFSGDQVVDRTTDDRAQYFITAGLFRRVRYPGRQAGGIQYGVVSDWLQDEYYVDMELAQIRAELSIIGPYCHELGVWVAVNTADDQEPLPPEFNMPGQIERWRSNDLYALFYRRNFSNGAEGRLWTGASDQGDWIFGGDFNCPLGDCWALQANFSFLEPHEGRNSVGQEQEAWALSLNLAWYIGKTARCSMRTRWRPLFQVADNSNFILERSSDGN